MKQLFILVFLSSAFLSQAQGLVDEFFYSKSIDSSFSSQVQHQVRIINQNNKVGYTVENDSGQVLWSIEPEYDFLQLYVSTHLSGILLGDNYCDSRNWNDTEFIEIPIDPNEPTITRVDTIVMDMKTFYPERLVIAKKNGKWGFLYSNGKEAVPFIYDSIVMSNFHLLSHDASYFSLVKNNRVSILNKKNEIVLGEEMFMQYYPNLSLGAQLDLIEIAFYGDRLVLQQGGKFIDSTVYVKAKTASYMERGKKKKMIVPAWNYKSYFFRGGKYNILNLKTGELQFKDWQDKILVKFTSNTTFKTPLLLDLTRGKSVENAILKQNRLALGDTLQIEFIKAPKPRK